MEGPMVQRLARASVERNTLLDASSNPRYDIFFFHQTIFFYIFMIFQNQFTDVYDFAKTFKWVEVICCIIIFYLICRSAIVNLFILPFDHATLLNANTQSL